MRFSAATIFFLYIIAVNIITFFIYALDKQKARYNKWRIGESTLLILAAAGGALGAFSAMHLCRHKTRKWKFAMGVPAILIIQAALAYFLVNGKIFL